MARILPTAEIMGPYAVKYTWSGTAPFDVWMNGEKVVDQSDAAEFIANRPGGGVPYAIEVRDANSTGQPEQLQYSPRVRLQWRGQSDALFYHVQRYTSGAWETRQIVMETGVGYYLFTTVAEADGATVQWRILAEDSNGYQGEVAQHTQTMVCNPSPPDVVGSYDAGTGDLTIEAAS